MVFGWTEEWRSSALRAKIDADAEARNILALARNMIANPQTGDIGWLLRSYFAGHCTSSDIHAWRFRQLTNELGVARGDLPPGGSFFTKSWSITLDAVRKFCPDLLPDVFIERDNSSANKIEILEECPNEIHDPAWPWGLGGLIRRPRRLPFRVYSSDDAVVYADAQRYQILSRDLWDTWETGTPRGLTAGCLREVEEMPIDGDVVVIQDRFGFANFCHFLYDAVTRVNHFIDALGYHDEIFILGGVPGRYQELVLQGVGDVLKVPLERFRFPFGKTLFKPTGQCHWFSDQKELHARPAQMGHPSSLAALARVRDKLPRFSGSARRLYISRGDADRRRISNESALQSALERLGFVTVQLSRYPIEDQIGLFQNADVVVGPHGMGLTNFVLSQSIGHVVELFNPSSGSDDYAAMARSSGINYDYILGAAEPGTPGDFSINVDAVATLLSTSVARSRRANDRKPVNLIPASRTFFGFSQKSPEPGIIWPGDDFSRMIADQETCVHWKTALPANTNVGKWSGIKVVPGRTYTASCWVWVPRSFKGQQVSIRISDVPMSSFNPADLQRTDQWQRISFTCTIPPAVERVSVALHIAGESGAGVVSTCWQLEYGDKPTGYVATA